ncbi:MAG: elongation factor G [Planctomycetota bacterium]|nr:MAG: elongation factor G [Planctomycetota bacterium]
MVGIDLGKVRNIGIAAHIDAGKTTTTERVLYYTGKTHRMGEVDDGTTITDFDQEEQQRGITIYSAAVSCFWHDHTINIIDTPGHVDFTAEVERSLRVLDGAIVVFDAKEGVEAQSETVWRQADKYHVPRLCFINKMDKVGADFDASFESIRVRRDARPAAVQIPIGAENNFKGIVDLLTMKAVYYRQEKLGSQFEERPLPPELEDAAKRARDGLEEQVAETSESLMEKFIHDEPITAEELREGIRAATIADKLHPVFCGSALNYIGVQRLLDGIVDYLPSPLEIPPVVGEVPESKWSKHGQVEFDCDPEGPLVVYAFKIVAEKPVDVYFVRVYSGRLKVGSRVFNPTRDRKEKVTRMFRVFAKKREQMNEAEAGDIVAIAGLKYTLTGDTLCEKKNTVVLEKIEFPETVISMSIEPQSSADREKLIESLDMLARETPTFEYQHNQETGQMLISGMGELHLEVLVNRLQRDRRIPVRVGKPRVSYRETVGGIGEYVEELKRQTAGITQYAKVGLRVEPFESASGQEHVRFESEVASDALRQEFLEVVAEAARDAAHTGQHGYPMINIKVTLFEAAEHEDDSTEAAFEAATRIAFDKAAEAAGLALMEPIMKVQIATPEAYFGAVSGDLSRRRGMVSDTRLRGDHRVINAQVPIKEMFGYATDLRSMTQGRGNWTMEPSHYAVVPAQIVNSILSIY